LRFLYKRTLKRKDLAFDDLIFPKVPHKLPTVLNREEVVRLIDAAPNRMYRILLALLYATGARRAEAARIKVEDIGVSGAVVSGMVDSAVAVADPNGGRPFARASSSCWRTASASAHWRVFAL
jgi:site-specific recombinase XerD